MKFPMTFNQALKEVNLFTMVVIMGGPAHHYDALTLDQSVIFDQEMYRLAQTNMRVHNILQRDGDKSALMAKCYDSFVQHTELATPIAYALAHASNSSGSLLFTHQSSPITNCEVANHNILEKVGLDEIIVYDYRTIEQWRNYCYINKQTMPLKMRSAQDTYRLPKMVGLNSTLALRKIPFGMDIIAQPQSFLREHQERLLAAITKQAEGLAKLCIYG